MKKLLLLTLSFLLIATTGFCTVDLDGDDSISNADDGNGVHSIHGANTDLTVSAWIKRDVDTGGSEMIVSKYESQSGNDRAWRMYVSNLDIVRCRISSNGTATTDVSATTPITAGTWYFATMVYDDSDTDNELRIYINGLSEATADHDSAGIHDSGADFVIGMNDPSAPNAFFNGHITEIGIQNIALTATQVLQFYTARLKTLPQQIQLANLKGYYPLDDQPAGTAGHGEIARDLSGSGNDGTLDDGANDSGMTWEGETVLSYPSPIIGQ